MRTDVAPSPYPPLFIATQPYEDWRRSRGRVVPARATCCRNDGLQGITYPIISTGRVRVRRRGGYGEEVMSDRLKDKVALVSGAGSSTPAGAMARRRRCSSPAKEQGSSRLTSTSMQP